MTDKQTIDLRINGEDKSAELHAFACFIGLESAAPGRYSALLVLHLFAGYASRRLNSAKVVREINALEGIGPPSRMKPPVLFKHPPLKGLWHKHYLADGMGTMVRNLRNGLNKDGLPATEQRLRDALSNGDTDNASEDDLKFIVHDAVIGNWERRAQASELTGEWIIYAEHAGANYYLCLGRHDSGDAAMRAQIDALCTREFPFLKFLLPSPPDLDRVDGRG